MAKVTVIFHSLYGHNYKMAMAEAEGAREVSGTEVKIYQVAELLSDEILAKMQATETKKTFANVPVATPQTLTEADAFIFGSPTRYGGQTASMRAFWDQTGGLWAKNALVGKIAAVFCSSFTQHGGQESTILTFIPTLLHQGFIFVGLPYAAEAQRTVAEISGGSPYGASCVAGVENSPTQNELGLARWQGRHVAEIAKKMFG